MIITLRKASQYSKALIEAGRKSAFNRHVNVSIYEDPSVDNPAAVLVELAQESLKEKLLLAKQQVTAGYELRGLIAKANAEIGIDSLLTEQANLSANESLIASVVDNRYDYDSSIEPQYADAKLVALKRQQHDASVIQHEDHIVVRVITPEICDPLKDDLAAIRRRKTEIADELLRLNASLSVPVSDFVKGLLKGLKLI